MSPRPQYDIEDAYAWYLQSSEIAANNFLSTVAIYLERISRRPQSFALYTRRTRRCVVSKFPYSVIFQEQAISILILAVAHAKRHPSYWKKRT